MKPDTPRRPLDKRTVALIATAAALAVLLAVNVVRPGPAEPTELTLSALTERAEKGEIATARIDDESRTVLATPRAALEAVSPDNEIPTDPEALDKALAKVDPADQFVAAFPYPYADELVKTLTADGVDVDASKAPEPPGLLSSLLYSLLPAVLLIGFLGYFLLKRGGLGPNTSLKRSSPVEVPTTRFADVEGQTEAVEDLGELTEFLHHPERFVAAGAKMPTGVLLVGPPGTGKTLLARAVAGEAGVPFFSLSGSDFVETYVGVGASRVRQIFDKARKHGRAIIFIDELDAVGRARVAQPQGGAEERESTLNQLLVEMDGFASSGVLVLAATNRPDILDPALLRPGRFDRQVAVPAPDRRGRERILSLYATAKKLDAGVDFSDLARRTTGFTGADLANLVNEAAIVAARSGTDTLSQRHLEEALQTVALGRARHSAQVTDRDREITAWHEAGHTVCALVSPLMPDPVQVTIIPRGASGGATWTGGRDEQYETAAELRAQLVVLLGGRAAEEVLLDGDHTPGAADDFRQATNLATKMVCEWGMSPLGVARVTPEHLDAQHAAQVWEQVTSICDQARAGAAELLATHRSLLEAVAAELLVEETLTTQDLHRLRDGLRQAPGGHWPDDRAQR